MCSCKSKQTVAEKAEEIKQKEILSEIYDYLAVTPVVSPRVEIKQNFLSKLKQLVSYEKL